MVLLTGPMSMYRVFSSCTTATEKLLLLWQHLV